MNRLPWGFSQYICSWSTRGLPRKPQLTWHRHLISPNSISNFIYIIRWTDCLETPNNPKFHAQPGAQQKHAQTSLDHLLPRNDFTFINPQMNWLRWAPAEHNLTRSAKGQQKSFSGFPGPLTSEYISHHEFHNRTDRHRLRIGSSPYVTPVSLKESSKIHLPKLWDRSAMISTEANTRSLPHWKNPQRFICQNCEARVQRSAQKVHA